VIAAIKAACREVLHLNSWMLCEPVLALADRLVGTLSEPLRRVMLLSTGGEGSKRCCGWPSSPAGVSRSLR
jgi:2,2-dialkylglycine decarboxylase (pyruvate)